MINSSIFFFITSFLATSTFAAPTPPTSHLHRSALRKQHTRRPKIYKFDSTSTTASNTSNHVSTNWSGGVLPPSASNSPYTSVGGRIVVPSLARPDNSTNGTLSGSAWVGIDGLNNVNAILQTGIDFSIDDDGTTRYGAWYEWLPLATSDFLDIEISEGDIVQMNVTAYSSSSGVAIIENITTGKKVKKVLHAPTRTALLTGANVEWIVEDFTINNGNGSRLAPLADWSSVTFSETWWKAKDGKQGTACESDVWDLIDEKGKKLSAVSVEDDGRVIDIFV